MSGLPLTDLLLDAIERQELASLVWGYVDGGLRREEAIGLAEALARESGEDSDAEALVEELITQSCLLECSGRGGTRLLRSRFAEGMRLLARLRQLFPGRNWEAASRLVSDFRVDRRPRRYPRRDIEPGEVLELLQAEVGLTPLQQALWRALTEPGGTPFKLARFQMDAVHRMLTGGDDSGCIVTAGTGSGKTFCFYLPALLELGEAVRADKYWVKTLAIYPRTELLKDQFAETFRLSRRLDPVLSQAGRRPLLLGALFAATPRRADAEELASLRWQRVPSGHVCPFLPCLRCGGDLIWRRDDLEAGREWLFCARTGCSGEVGPAQILLTRTSILRTPPDLLFATTEMLNRRLADTVWRSLFGAGKPSGRRPRLILLDEIHTYTGTSGAHVALVLRRWRHAVGGPVRWVGLSATLMEAERFFAELIGLPASRVLEVTPASEEMQEEGAEYQVILRGDPVAQASLLSTSIQAAMVLGRLMDPPGRGRSEGRYGNRLFVFTDDLDVTNRLFDNLKDAEAYDIFGRPDGRRQPLAALRSRVNEPVVARRREQDGQRWLACEEIGRPLTERLRVSRTTSQDVGISAGSDVIVATAALEVGYNDPGVGAVLQHKAPRSFAAYLQRKGRAGRDRRMRPWMVTVLSDYGRDRLAYQGYEQLFDPVIPPQTLPIGNLYLLRMQAVFALIDWLALQMPECEKVWLWDLFSRPNEQNDQDRKRRTRLVLKVLASLMRCEEAILGELRGHLQEALQIGPETVSTLLWEPPRSLLLETIPILARRLYTDWWLAFPVNGGPDRDLYVPWQPLPDFVPANLFSELGLPDVQIILPPATRNREETRETLPLVQALNQLVPGRVTRRFAYQRGGLNHWLPVNWEHPENWIELRTLAEVHEYLGDFGPDALPVFRPWTVRLQAVGQHEVLPTSNANWDWESEFIPRGEVLELPAPARTAWQELMRGVRCYQHAFRSAVSVRRFAPAGRASIRRFEGGGMVEYPVTIHLTAGHRPAAIGFEQEVDGLVLEYDLPSASELAAMELPIELLAVSRSAFFRHLLLTDPELGTAANPFLRDWLRQIYVSALVTKAAREGLSLNDACERLHATDSAAEFAQVMTGIFNFQGVEDDEEDEERRQGGGGRLRQRLSQLLADPRILERLKQLAASLWAPEQEPWGQWLRRRIHETLAQAWLDACLHCAPRQAAVEALLVDPIEPGTGGPGLVWITETTLGGVGVIQALGRVYAKEPRRLFRATEAALAPGDQELAGAMLRRFLELVCTDREVEAATARLRETQSHAEREAARRPLFDLLQQHGLPVGHAFSIALNARLLRSGMGLNAYQLLRELLAWWDQLQERLGVLVEQRMFCYLAAIHSDFGPRIQALMGVGGGRDLTGTVQALAGILWPQSGELRQHVLQSLHPFRPATTTDPHLVRTLLLYERTPEVTLGATNWRNELQDWLAEEGSCRIRCRPDETATLRATLVSLLAEAVAVGYLHLYPAVERFEREPDVLVVVLTLREEV